MDALFAIQSEVDIERALNEKFAVVVVVFENVPGKIFSQLMEHGKFRERTLITTVWRDWFYVNGCLLIQAIQEDSFGNLVTIGLSEPRFAESVKLVIIRCTYEGLELYDLFPNAEFRHVYYPSID